MIRGKSWILEFFVCSGLHNRILKEDLWASLALISLAFFLVYILIMSAGVGQLVGVWVLFHGAPRKTWRNASKGIYVNRWCKALYEMEAFLILFRFFGA